jgi:hypothetical protein
MNYERYEPSAAEMALAEEMMTPEQKAASLERATFKFQEKDPFDDFLAHIDQNDERREPSPEERENMDDRLRKLGELFEGSDVRWNLDGATNISLMAGAYIGVHKDLDISVEAADLAKFDGLLMKNGYGLFLSRDKDATNPRSPRILERVGADRFAAADIEHRLVVAIDERGAIKSEGNLNFIDVHLVTRDAAGRVIGPGGSVLPEKWSTPTKKTVLGYVINLSHPAKLAFFKLHESRVYDRTDLKKLVELGGLTLDDVKDIEKAFKEDTDGRYRKGEAFVASIAAKLRPKMDAREIRDVFLSNAAFAKRIRPEDEPAFLDFCAQVAGLEEKTPAKVTELAMEAFGANKKFKELRAKVVELRQWVVDIMET